MVEHRKYLPQELDYVLSRIAAGWKLDTIAKAFKQEFASHWADRLFTRKQVQYIKNTYRRPPGTIKPYDGPIPVFSSSPSAIPHDHNADLRTQIGTALKVNHYGKNESQHFIQANNPMAGPSRASAQPSMAGTGNHGQQYVEDGNMFTSATENYYNLENTNQSSLIQNSSGHHATAMNGMLDPVLQNHTEGGSTYGVTNNYQPDAVAGAGTQFSRAPQWTQTAPGSAHARFSGYASQLRANFNQAIPSLENSLLNSPAPDKVLSGEQVEQLLQGPGPDIEFVSYGECPANFGMAENETPETTFPDVTPGGAAQTGRLENPLGCSLDSTAYTDRSGWWYPGHHDGWCRISSEHRHDYDGGVYFRNFHSYTQNIDTERNDHVTGFLLGLSHQLQSQQHHSHGEAVCLHRSCEEARQVAQQMVDASLPEGHDLRQAPLHQPHPMMIRLLHDLNDRLPEGYVYDPISHRVVRCELPKV